MCAACAALVFMGVGCDRPLSLAIGPAGDITVFSDRPAESPELATLVEGLEREVSFIGKPELTFNVELAGREGFDLRRHWRNLVFVGSLDEGSWVSEMIAGLLSEENMSDLRRGKQEVFFIKDRWAIGQMIAIISSAEGDELAAAVEDNIGVLYEMMDRAAVENTRRILLRKDVKRDAARYLLSEYGWSLTLPEGFEGTEDSEHGVAFFRTEEPSRIILVHWRDEFEEDLTPERCLAIRGEIAWNYYDEDRVDRELTTVSQSDFAGRDAVKLDGIWQNDKHVNGGPFRSYCFTEGGRLYLIDMVLFAPGDDKLPYLRELEAIAMTFSTE
jgi:hypothetical protein